jgi:aminoglycoside phosphotransferase family enzyme/predicted kinase
MESPDLVDALAEPAFYPHRPDTVEHVQTHISHVFLAGAYAYKLKKPVRFPFVDFSTIKQRHHYCLEEIRLNRRLSPTVYLDVVPITQAADGRPQLAGTGAAIDYVVRMRRLPSDGMVANRIQAGRVPPMLMSTIATTLAAFHAAAPSGPRVAAYAAPDALRARWSDNMEATRPYVGRLFSDLDFQILSDFGPDFIDTHETVLRARQHGGHIREGHGDLHADNVCFLDTPEPAEGQPPLAPGLYIFDCIEFSEAFRCNDVASEIAFLAMDLDSLGRPDLARSFVAAYADTTLDPMVHILLPFYAAYRACVRAKVECLKSAEPEVDERARREAIERAREHFALAVRFAWQAHGPAIIACTGLSGTGKSTVAESLAAATGFELLSSDRIRKREASRRATTAAAMPDSTEASRHYGCGLYSAARRQATYVTLCSEIESVLTERRGVIADATFLKWNNRLRLAGVANRQRCPHVFVECTAAEPVVRARLHARETTPSMSDARWDTYTRQRDDHDPFGSTEPHITVDTSRGLEIARAAALRALWAWRKRTATCNLDRRPEAGRPEIPPQEEPA